jgi:cell division initiation protein
MPLTPIDVQQKTFVTTFRGYDLDEVDDFLDEVVTSLKDYEQRLHDAQQRIAVLETQAVGRGDSEAAISRALVSAQRSADLIVSEAKNEADRVLAEAKLDAKTLETERGSERTRLEGEIGEMHRVVAELKQRLAALAAPMLEDTETMEAATTSAESELAAIGVGIEVAPEDLVAPSADRDWGHDGESTGFDDYRPAAEPVGVEAGSHGMDWRFEEPTEETTQPTIEEATQEATQEATTDGATEEVFDGATEEVFDLGAEFESAETEELDDESESDLVSLGWEVARDQKVSEAVDELELPEVVERIPRPWEDV